MSFTLRGLLLVITLIAVALFALVAAPPPIAIPLLAICHLIWPAVLIAGVSYGRKYVRAFSMGAMVPACMFLVPLSLWFTFSLIELKGSMNDWTTYFGVSLTYIFRAYTVVIWIASIAAGIISAAMRALLMGNVDEHDTRRPT